MRPSRFIWRVRGIPRDVDRKWVARALRRYSDLQWPADDRVQDSENYENDVTIRTIAPDLRDDYQVATVRFHNHPLQLSTLGARGELTIKINMNSVNPRMMNRCDSALEVLIDRHFDGITTLFSPVTDKEHQIDLLAVSGLGSHPFGSFAHKENGNMWLVDNLPRDIPGARVMIFGYESKLENSRSHVELDGLATALQIAIGQISRCYKRNPLVLIGHSLGGLLVKEALVRSAEPGSEPGLSGPVDMITGILLFGTPNDGLNIESLVPMVNNQPNRSLLESLRSTGSQMLRRQKREFSNVLEGTNLHLFCFYETEESPTAAQDPETGEWKMGGPLRLLVSQSSATSCLPSGAPFHHSVSIRRNHSDLVKFSSHDAEYDKVAYVLQQVQHLPASARTHERQWKSSQGLQGPEHGDWPSGQQREPTRGTHVRHPVKRCADETVSSSAGKRPRLASNLPENGQSQAGSDPASNDAMSKDELENIQKELIGRLYFSKIDERLTHLAPAQVNTCHWFLTDSKYQSWQDAAQRAKHGGFLWIQGNPGTGKSTLMKFLFEETKIESQHDASRITLSFFFLARGTAEERTTIGLYRSLLHQLFEVAPYLKESMTWMTIDGGRTIQQNGWSEEALKQTLKHAVPELGNRSLTMFVDALDECDAAKVDGMVSFFEDLCECAAEARVQLRICFSSRYYPTVVINKGLEVSLEDENGHTEDIQKYVKSKLRLKSQSKNTDALRSEILEKSSGIFLWVVLVVDILNKESSMSIQKLRKHLKEIPPGLGDLFRMILARDGESLEQLQLCFNCILFASRALQPQELYFAIEFGSDDECSGFWDRTDLDFNDMKTFVRSSSKGLAEVTRNNNDAPEVHFIHESVRDFLLGKYVNSWSETSENLQGHGHRVLRDCCLAQLKYPINQKIQISAMQTTELRNSIGFWFPFFRYAVRNVLHHSNLAQQNGFEQQQFLSVFPLKRWIHFNNILEEDEVRRYTDSASLLYILGENNLADLIRIHSEKRLCFQGEGGHSGAPIFAAVANNSREAIREFLEARAEIEPLNSPLRMVYGQYEHNGSNRTTHSRTFIFKGRTPINILQDLIEREEEAVALAFVLNPQEHDHILRSSDSGDFITLLESSSLRGQWALFRVLLQLGTIVDRNSEWPDMLLRRAVGQGSAYIVKKLLDGDAGFQTSCQGRQEALRNAAKMGHWAMVETLVDGGVKIDSKNGEGETALSIAVQWGHNGLVRTLLEKGADRDSRCRDGRTPLSLAAVRSRADIVKLLLEKGADIESRDNDNRTPLSFAAGQLRSDIAWFLLDKGANIESKDTHGRTPLSRAAESSNSMGSVAFLLLERSADIHSRDEGGRTPLSWAAGNPGHEVNVTRALLERGVDIESRDNDGRTPLSWASGNGAFQNVGLLLNEGANIHSKDKDGRTPLSWALLNRNTGSSGVENVIALLQNHLHQAHISH